MKPPYNVLHIVATNHLSGAERMVQLIGKNLNHEVFHPIIVCTGEPLSQIYKRDGHVVEIADVLQPLPGNILRLRSIIRKRNIHLIHAHDHRASLLAWLGTRLLGRIPVISHIHSTNPWLKGWQPFKLVEIIIRNRYDISIACSDTVRNYFLRYNPFLKTGKILTVTNGIEIEGHSPVNQDIVLNSLEIPPERFIYGTVGRLHHLKGIDLLLRAFKVVSACSEQALLLIVGSGPEEHALKALARELGLEDRVVFTGYREDVYNLFQVMDVFVLASRWEGLPMVLMEAMSRSLPVVATDVGGVRELVRPGETGLLVNSGDVAELAEKMIFLYRQRGFAVALATSGFELIRGRFDITKQVKRIEKLYQALLEGGEQPCSVNRC